jgi:hypothetical protein
VTVSAYPAWRQAARDLASTFSYGDVVTLDWLSEAFMLPAPKTIKQYRAHQFAFLHHLDALRQELLEQHQLALRNIRGEGYEVVHPNNQVDFAWTTAFTRVRRELGKLASNITHIRHHELSDDKRREHSDAQAKLSSVMGFVDRAERRRIVRHVS